MSWEAWFTLGVVVATVVVLARGWLPPSGTMMGALVAVLVAGVVEPSAALAGFGNPAPMTIAALYVLARAAEKTGLLAPVVGRILGTRPGRVSLARMTISTTAASGFLNNTPIAAMLIPQIEAWCRAHDRSPSHYLMPLSFAAVFGGVITLMGTATNIVASGLLESIGEEPLGFFEVTWVGLPIAVVGVAAMVLLAPLVLPKRRSATATAVEEFREFVFDMEVTVAGPIDGAEVQDAGLRHLTGVFLTEIHRDGELIAPVAPTMVLRGADQLRFVGRAADIMDLQAIDGLYSTEAGQLLELGTGAGRFFEAVLGGESPLLGLTVRAARFRSRYQAAVLAVHRAGRRIDAKVGDVELQIGDTLLLIADAGFKQRWGDRRDFLLISPLRPARPVATSRARLVAVVAVGIIAAVMAGLLPMVTASLLGATALVLGRAVTPNEAREAVDLDVVVTIAAAFGLAAAIQISGLGLEIADLLVGIAEPFGKIAVLGAVVVATIVLKEVVTNKAAVLLLTPIGFAVASSTGSNPRAYAIAIAVAAALAFLTPVGYPTNTMVYGPGGYRYSDYLRLGLPLTLIAFVGIMIIVPGRWPL